MSRKHRQPARHPLDGKEMTAPEIAGMLGISLNTLYSRRSQLGGASYQVVVDTYRANLFGNYEDRSPRYMVDGRWMSRRQIADMLGISRQTLANWLSEHKGKTVQEAIAWYRGYQTGERKRGHGPGRPGALYRAGRRTYTVSQVARMFGVTRTSVENVLKRRGGDMAATIRHYREREDKRKRMAEAEIMRILGF